MHEIGMCEGVLATVERRAGDRSVSGLGVRVGAALRVVPAAFEQAFELVSAGTVAEGASVDLVTVPVSGTCRDCAAEFESADPMPGCPSCGSTNVDARGGDELVLEWLSYEEQPEQPPATATSVHGEG